jgi:hypothetical protein
MMPGRSYGLGKWGRNTYDHWRIVDRWVPIPVNPPVEIWVPSPDTPVIPPPSDIWTPANPVTEIWTPVSDTPVIPSLPDKWTPIPNPSTPWG